METNIEKKALVTPEQALALITGKNSTPAKVKAALKKAAAENVDMGITTDGHGPVTVLTANAIGHAQNSADIAATKIAEMVSLCRKSGEWLTDKDERGRGYKSFRAAVSDVFAGARWNPSALVSYGDCWDLFSDLPDVAGSGEDGSPVEINPRLFEHGYTVTALKAFVGGINGGKFKAIEAALEVVHAQEAKGAKLTQREIEAIAKRLNGKVDVSHETAGKASTGTEKASTGTEKASTDADTELSADDRKLLNQVKMALAAIARGEANSKWVFINVNGRKYKLSEVMEIGR